MHFFFSFYLFILLLFIVCIIALAFYSSFQFSTIFLFSYAVCVCVLSVVRVFGAHCCVVAHRHSAGLAALRCSAYIYCGMPWQKIILCERWMVVMFWVFRLEYIIYYNMLYCYMRCKHHQRLAKRVWCDCMSHEFRLQPVIPIV